MLAAPDVLVLLKIIAKCGQSWTQSDIAGELFVSQSVVSRGLKTAERLNLFRPAQKRVNGRQLEDALVHGARYFLAPQRGGEVRGMLTAWAAPPLVNELVADEPLPPVWPDPIGEVRGLSVEPLHPNAPKASRLDPGLYEMLALLDVLRIGGARECGLATRALHERLER